MERVLLRDNPGSRLGRPHPQEPEVRLRRRPLRLLHHGFVDLAKGLEVLSQVVVGDAWGEAAEKKLRRRARRQLWRRIHAHRRGSVFPTRLFSAWPSWLCFRLGRRLMPDNGAWR